MKEYKVALYGAFSFRANSEEEAIALAQQYVEDLDLEWKTEVIESNSLKEVPIKGKVREKIAEQIYKMLEEGEWKKNPYEHTYFDVYSGEKVSVTSVSTVSISRLLDLHFASNYMHHKTRVNVYDIPGYMELDRARDNTQKILEVTEKYPYLSLNIKNKENEVREKNIKYIMKNMSNSVFI